MFRIRREQVEAFARAMRIRFEEDVGARIRASYPDQVIALPEEVLRTRIHRTVDRALGYGIEAEADVADFVDLTFQAGENFEADARFDWAMRILRDPELEGGEKIDGLREGLGQDLNASEDEEEIDEDESESD